MKRKIKIFFILLAIIIISINIAFILVQNSKLIYTIPYNSISIVAEDIDLDGDNDIITGHHADGYYSDTGVVILRNIGNGFFNENYESLQLLGYQYDILANDLTNDQFPEIVAFKTDFGNASGLYIRVYYNNGGTFSQHADFPMNISEPVWSKTFGDIDSDNDIDIIIASANAYKWGLMTNDGNGNLSSPQYFNIDYAPVDIECADMNNDSLMDILIAGTDNTLFINTGNEYQEIIFEYSHLQNVKAEDFNNDGINDVMGIESFWKTNLFIYENNWDTTFTKHTSLVYDSVLYNPVIGDVNNDSLPDVVCVSFSGIFVMINNTGYSLKLPDYYPFPINCYVAGHAFFSDLDNDGWTDIAAVLPHPTELSTQLMVLFNDQTGHFVENPATGLKNPEPPVLNLKLDCFPNPFDREVTISIETYKQAIVKVEIIGLSGRQIKSLYTSRLKPENLNLYWDGKNEIGQLCQKGIYLVVLHADTSIYSKKLIFN